ncbi:hypothetical protein [Amycolatopsis saalfeldensis]|uniref:Uncharacterized protein n=1 Tax=Amycolatopsis saalfeldensis TaxID=394193 RepID=A0A1H8YN51_9PSEU|nr:hypothetical protein [Amycolatopsis saalfeldensis]SEP53607.1 hypothetical protein SAMN04489732_12932 [Amycolatopsis saalfeldensis]
MRDAARELADLQAHDDLVARIYADHLPGEIRELALALAWVRLRDPARHAPDADSSLTRAARLLGCDETGRWRHKLGFAADAPRYEPGREHHLRSGVTCQGPRIRPYRPRGSAPATATASTPPNTALVCGGQATIGVEEHDLATGHIVALHAFCRRHREDADRVLHQIAARGEPLDPPIPNTGGWLPRYFTAKPLERLYRWARPGWARPDAGLCRDDWLTGDVRFLPRHQRLALVVTAEEVPSAPAPLNSHNNARSTPSRS